MRQKEIPELHELLETVTRATADGRMLWEIAGCSLHQSSVLFLCKTDWAHFACRYSREEGRHHLSIMAPMEVEVAGVDPEILTADIDDVVNPLVGILYRCLMDRFRDELIERLGRMRRAVSDINRKLVEALARDNKEDKEER